MRGLKNKLSNLFEKILLFNYLGLFLCEILSIKFYFFSRVGVYLWFLSWFLIIIYVFRSLICILKKRKVFSIVTAFSFIVLINTVNPVNLSGETTQQIAQTLNHFKNSLDLGFRQTVMFGYPARQFFLSAIFSHFFERNQFFLNFGGALYYIFGLIIFSKGLLDYFKKKKENQIFTGIILSFIPHIYWLNHFVFFYEQSFFPFIFSLMICGLFLSYLTENSKKYLLLIGFLINYLIFSYTPSLAFVFFALIACLYLLIFKKGKEDFYLIALIIFVSIISLFSSFDFRKDVNLFGSEMTRDLIIKNLVTGFRHLIFIDQGKPFVSTVFQTVFLITIFYSIINFRKIEIFFSGWWIVLVLVLSIISKGYTYYGIDFRLQRVMVIFPVLFLLIAGFLKSLKIEFNKNIFSLILIFFILTGYFFQWDLLEKREPSRHLAFINFLRKKVKENVLSRSSRLIVSNKFYYEYLSLHDSLQYFLPEMSYIFLDNYQDNSVDNKNTVFILTREDKNYNDLINKKNIIGSFTFRNDLSLFLYK
ncbi:MAG: hypothetical protein N2482_03175 [Patescibacteria group bacterium]|nr:hypothetical protein [Patescibacteria group bacterium]